ncbi:MAG: DUF6941 family protein [Isosphaeraceae bacterium]
MELAYVITANYAEITSGRLNIAGADFNVLFVPKVPVIAPGFFLVTKALLDPNEIGQPFQIQIRMLDPDGNPLPQPQVDEPIVVPEPDDPDLPNSASLVCFVQPSEFQRVGVYRVRVRIGDQERSLPIKVIRREVEPLQ